jgi:hypothetical protein
MYEDMKQWPHLRKAQQEIASAKEKERNGN